jgi:hypothetical protein
MVPHTPSPTHHVHRLSQLLARRFLGISGRYWVIAGIVLGLCFSIYAARTPMTPNAFDDPAAQIPNRLRSPWGVEKPL